MSIGQNLSAAIPKIMPPKRGIVHFRNHERLLQGRFRSAMVSTLLLVPDALTQTHREPSDAQSIAPTVFIHRQAQVPLGNHQEKAVSYLRLQEYHRRIGTERRYCIGSHHCSVRHSVLHLRLHPSLTAVRTTGQQE